MNKDLAICSVAFHHKVYGDEYIKQQERLSASVKDIYPHAFPLFWTNQYPQGSKEFLESLYGFKPHAIEVARLMGYKRIAYIDTAMVMLKPIEGKFPLIAVRDDSTTPASDNSLKFFGVKRESLKDIPFVGGSFYLFDFNYPITEMVFDLWMKAERAGIYGSQDEESAGKLQGHRHDETCLALSMHTHGMLPLNPDQIGYNMETGTMMKKHFK